MPTGVPTKKRQSPAEADIRRFWSKVRRGQDCWEWIAGPSKGYGQFYTRPIPGGPQICWKAHRLAFLLCRGRMPAELIYHTCDNPRCVNPEHLFEGTIQINIGDRDTKRRQSHGENHARAKVTEAEVNEILRTVIPRKRGRSSGIQQQKGMSVSEAARKYGLSRRAIRKILMGETWKHVGH